MSRDGWLIKPFFLSNSRFCKIKRPLSDVYSGQQETVTAPLGKCHLHKPRVLSPLRERSGLSTLALRRCVEMLDIIF